MDTLRVHIINDSPFEIPRYATAGAAGMDLRAHLESPLVLKSLERALIPTGISMQIPAGFEGQIRPRSGLALHQGITCLNTPGTIDSDYRGEIKVLLINLSETEQTITPGDRIAQLIFNAVAKAVLIQSATLPDTQRGQGGFGHTGTK